MVKSSRVAQIIREYSVKSDNSARISVMRALVSTVRVTTGNVLLGKTYAERAQKRLPRATLLTHHDPHSPTNMKDKHHFSIYVT